MISINLPMKVSPLKAFEEMQRELEGAFRIYTQHWISDNKVRRRLCEF
jgi:hypothetical protein